MVTNARDASSGPVWPVPEDEVQRLAELISYRISDAAEADLDHIVELASDLLDVPVALINLAYDDHMKVKARIGADIETVPRSLAFCSHTIMTPDVLVVPDLGADERFKDNDLVTGPTNVRFYAGAPLRTKKGTNIGAICVLDTQARNMLTEKQQRILQRLADLVMDKLELRRLQHADLVNSQFVNSTAEAFLCVDCEGTISHWNPAAERMFGWSRAEAVGQPVNLIVPDRFHGSHSVGFGRVAKGGVSKLAGRSVELSAVRADGKEFPVELLISVWEHEGTRGMGAVMRDLSIRKQHENRLHYLAHHDHLTGLLNRHRFCELIEATTGSMEQVSVLLVDIDGFRGLNDSLGHDQADTLLQSFAVRMTACLDPDMHIARLGGDDFGILIAGGDTEAQALAQRIQASALEAFELNNRSATLSVSIGIATAGEAGSSALLLLAAADLALFDAKTGTRGHCSIFRPRMRERLVARRELSAQLHAATRDADFVMHYQPQVNLCTGTLIGCEALLRWNHADRGLLYPAAFIEVLDHAECSEEVGWWTLDEACRQLAAWDSQGLQVPCVGVNLFGKQFRTVGFTERVMATLARHRLTPDRLELELTETLALAQGDASLSLLHDVRARGVRLAFDDFGTGFASLSTLKRIPLTRLKIDKSFVGDLASGNDDIAVVRAVVGIARDLRLSVIAEGIETEQQARQLRQLGCCEGQGFLFGRGLPFRDFAAIYHQGNGWNVHDGTLSWTDCKEIARPSVESAGISA